MRCAWTVITDHSYSHPRARNRWAGFCDLKNEAKGKWKVIKWIGASFWRAALIFFRVCCEYIFRNASILAVCCFNFSYPNNWHANDLRAFRFKISATILILFLLTKKGCGKSSRITTRVSYAYSEQLLCIALLLRQDPTLMLYAKTHVHIVQCAISKYTHAHSQRVFNGLRTNAFELFVRTVFFFAK